MYGNMHKKEGEQTSNTEIKTKLKDLSERQENLHGVTMKIVKGDNK
jgi:fructose-bisphosphate aldolase class 1